MSRSRAPALLAVALAVLVAPFALAGAGGVASGTLSALQDWSPGGQTDWLAEVQRGNVSGVSAINKFGHNADIDTATVPESVWSRGGLHVPPTAARTHQIASTDDEDGGAGTDTGALTLRVYGLDASWNEQQEDVTLNGLSDVATANTYTRIFRMKVLTAGSGGTNAGTITATADTDSTVTAEIPAGDSQTQMAVWTVPTGKTAYLSHAYVASHREGATAGLMTQMDLMVRTGIDGANPVLIRAQTLALSQTGSSLVSYHWPIPKKIEGPADIEIRVTYCSDNNAHISAGFDAFYE